MLGSGAVCEYSGPDEIVLHLDSGAQAASPGAMVLLLAEGILAISSGLPLVVAGTGVTVEPPRRGRAQPPSIAGPGELARCGRAEIIVQGVVEGYKYLWGCSEDPQLNSVLQQQSPGAAVIINGTALVAGRILTHIGTVDRIVNKTIERMGVHMPQYHQLPENWGKRGWLTISPRPFIRKLLIIKSILPYHVGDRVKFSVKFEHPNPKTGLMSQVLYEKFGNNNIKPLASIDKVETEIVGSIINGEGDIEYCVGYTGNVFDLEPIFTARVESWDTIISKWAWVIVGALFSFACGVLLWLLGFIKLIPAWEAWIQH